MVEVGSAQNFKPLQLVIIIKNGKGNFFTASAAASLILSCRKQLKKFEECSSAASNRNTFWGKNETRGRQQNEKSFGTRIQKQKGKKNKLKNSK